MGPARRVEHRDERSGGTRCRREGSRDQYETDRKYDAFYGEAASEKLFSLLDANIDAVREYSEATAAGDKRQQDAALAHLSSNADEIADFLSHLNPYLQKDIVRGLIATHGAHHVLQINQFKAKDYAPLGATWPMMRQHIYVIADTLTTALVKQFTIKFS